MLLPHKTDAPLYYPPTATVWLMLVNMAAFALAYYIDSQTSSSRAITSLMLQYGGGLYPRQWLMANFVHLDIFQLLGNLLGLWIFGMIVEGKIGWRKFLAVYLLLGMVTMATTQVLGQSMPWGRGMGASAAVYGLMGIAMIWAPLNEIEWFAFIPFETATFDLAVWATAGVYLAIQLTIAAVSTHSVTTELLHMMGAGYGMAAGFVMLHKGWVDCENWDLLSVWAGRNRLSREELALEEAIAAAPTAEERSRQRAAALDEMRRVLKGGQAELALAVHRSMSNQSAEWRLPEDILRHLIAGCVKEQKFDDAVLLMRDYLQQYAEYAAPMRLKLAEVLIRRQHRPLQARRVLAKIPGDGLRPAQSGYRRQLDQLATEMIEQGLLEPETEDW